MGFTKVILVIFVGVVAWMCYNCSKTPSLPVLEKNPWWGPGEAGKDNPLIKRFKINILNEDIDDFKTRLSLPLHLAPPLENANFTYGFNSEVLRTVVHYWNTKYDWKEREEKINVFPSFRTQIEGLEIYFRHVKPKLPSDSRHLTVVPLLMVHGWPGSILEFDEIIPLLTTPQEGSDVVFEVITPSLPGYGFSQASAKQGLRCMEISQIFLKLMNRLGFEKFYIQGGDWGHLVVSSMATLFPDNVIGMHSNSPSIGTPDSLFKYVIGQYLPSGFMMKEEVEAYVYPVSKFFKFLMMETGYMHLQSTKPDTIGAALSQSPVSLAAYILEKFSTWTHKTNPPKQDGGLFEKDFPISLDRLLDNVSFYWFTRSITSSMRLYKESLSSVDTFNLDKNPTNVPAGFSAFAQDLIMSPENHLVSKYKNLLLFRVHEEGGHFAAMEVPKILSKDIHAFVNLVQKLKKNPAKKEL